MRFAAGTLVGWYGAQTPGAVRQALKRYRKRLPQSHAVLGI